MALVPWTYNNPRLSNKSQIVAYSFSKKVIKLTQDLTAEINVEKNTAFKIWDGSFLLAKYLDNRNVYPDKFWAGKKCVELGSGCGLVGIVAWSLGADVILTDLPEVLDHTKKCCALNQEENSENKNDNELLVSAYSWGEEFVARCGDFDFIFGSDIVYEPRLNLKLIKSLKLLCSSSTQTLISYKPRGLGEHVFFDLLEKENFRFEKIARTLHTDEFKNSDYDLYVINKK